MSGSCPERDESKRGCEPPTPGSLTGMRAPRSVVSHAKRTTRALLALSVCAGACAYAAGAAQAASAPGANTLAASSIAYSSATLNGNVNPRGQATDYVFQYGTTRQYGSQTPLAPVGAGSAVVKVSQTITGLAPLTTYHYRILATNPSGATAGPERTFTTPRVPLSLAIAGVPNPVPFGSPLLVEGTLSGTNSADHEVELQANAFPYTTGFQVIGNPEVTSSTGTFSFPYLGLTQERPAARGHRRQTRSHQQRDPRESGRARVLPRALHQAPWLRAPVRDRHPRRGRRARRLPAAAARQVRQQGRHRRQSRSQPNYSTFSRVVRVQRGLYKALIQVAEGAHVSAYSNPVLIR